MDAIEVTGELNQRRQEISRLYNNAKELAELAGDDGKRNPVEETNEDWKSEEIDDEAQAQCATDEHQRSADQCHCR